MSFEELLKLAKQSSKEIILNNNNLISLILISSNLKVFVVEKLSIY